MPGFSINTKKYGHFNKKLPTQLHTCAFLLLTPWNHFLFERMENKDYSCCMRECYRWITVLTSADGQRESIVTFKILSRRSRCHIQGNSTIPSFSCIFCTQLISIWDSYCQQNDHIIHYHLNFSLPGRNDARISSNVVWKWSWTGNRVCERACSG